MEHKPRLLCGDSSPPFRPFRSSALPSEVDFVVCGVVRPQRDHQSDESAMLPLQFALIFICFPVRTMTGRRRPRRGQNSSGERLFWSLAVVIVVLAVTYWYDGGEDEAITQTKDKSNVRLVRKRREQCRTSCEDIILEAATPMPTQRGDSSSLHGAENAEQQHLAAAAAASAMRSVLEGNAPAASSEVLTTSAVGALFHRRQEISVEGHGHDQHDPSQTESPSLHVAEAASRTGISTTASSSSAMPKAMAARPTHLPPLIEKLVGAIDSDATQNDAQDDVRSRRNLIRRTKVDEQRARQASLDSVIGGGDIMTKTAAAAVATFWSSLQSRSHTLLGRPRRMRNVNEEWDAALRWIAGWSEDELNADAAVIAAAKAKKADAFKRRGRIQSRKASRSGQSAAKWDLVERLTAEEASELLLLIDVCVDRCVDMMAEDSAWDGPKGRRSVVSRYSGGAVTDVGGNRSGQIDGGSLLHTFMSPVLPGEHSSRALVAGILGLFFSSALVCVVHLGYDLTLLWKHKKEPSSAWVGSGKEHDDRLAIPSRKSGGKKGKRRSRRQPKSSPVDESTKQGQDEKAALSDREEVPGAQTVRLSKSPSQTSLSDDDDAILVGLIRNTNRSATSTSSDTSVRTPIRTIQRKSTSAGVPKQLAAPQCDMRVKGSTPMRQQKAKNRNTISRQMEFPVPTEAQRHAANQQLREFQRIQLTKLFLMKKEAKLAAERAAAVRKKTSVGVSYSSVASNSSPPLSPPRLTTQASAVGQKHREPRREGKDAETENAFSSYATSPRSNIATPCRDLVQDHPLNDVAGELLLSSLSGMLDEEEDEFRNREEDYYVSVTGNAIVSPPPGFASSSNATAHPTGAGEYRESPRNGSSPAVSTLNIARVASSTWSTQSLQSGGARSIGGSHSDIW